jgi:imidazolonepropionase
VLADLIITNAREIFTCAGPAPKCGPAQRDAGTILDGVIAAHEGRIVFVGSADEAHSAGVTPNGARVIDAGGGTILPGFVDPHTHVVYAGDRRHELRRRLGGATYAGIAAEGGGILTTVAATRAASEEQLAELARVRLNEMLRCGTTTCEAKSGYGLTTESELRLLRAIRAVDRSHPIDIVPTFMGAHEVPPEHTHHRDDYIRLVIDEMIPAVAAERLAEWCDVFCESGVFTTGESRDILLAGRRAGLKSRIHANELGSSGGIQVAVDVGARSADHVVFADPAEAEAMARAGVVATLLPAAAFYLKLGRMPPARSFIEAGVPVALATDVNPGGGFSPSMPFAMAVGCFSMGLTLEEAIVAATINAAYSLDRHVEVGSLEVGKAMDAVLLPGPAVDLLRVGVPAIRAVIKRGRIVAGLDVPERGTPCH